MIITRLCSKYSTKIILTKGIWLNILFTGRSSIQNVKLLGHLLINGLLLSPPAMPPVSPRKPPRAKTGICAY